jgi:hypothetical protein
MLTVNIPNRTTFETPQAKKYVADAVASTKEGAENKVKERAQEYIELWQPHFVIATIPDTIERKLTGQKGIEASTDWYSRAEYIFVYF